VADGIPDNVRGLIIERISSVLQLEILLLLHGQPGRRWSAQDVAGELRIDVTWAEGQLHELCGGGLLACHAGGAGAGAAAAVYQYGPAAEERRRAVDDLARVYAERRVTVVSMIFSKPTEKIRTFADAFRLRKEKGDG
jgi:predicted ArsR family transcriptional regulator